MRKDTLITIIMGVISIFTSCNPHPNLSKADQLINSYPDSSLTYLKAIQHPENMSPKDYAKWCLLVAQAKYNNAQSLVPDSFVFKAFDYFSKDTSDPILTARTYFYTALISKEIRNIEEAAQYLLKARDFAEKANDYNLAFKISHDLCDIYSKQGLFIMHWQIWDMLILPKSKSIAHFIFSKRHSLLLKKYIPKPPLLL